MGKPLNDLTGKTFGRIAVLCRDTSRYGKATWICRCECGTEWSVIGSDLIRGHAKSCGCAARQMISVANRKDGTVRRGTKLYTAWHNLKSRCLNPKNPLYYRYGGRGITVHPEWIVSFEAFRDHIGPAPGPEYTVERINNDRGYEPGNIEWATRKKQSNNQKRGGTTANPKGEGNVKAKLTEADVRFIRESTASTLRLANLYGVANWTIGAIRRRKTWKHVT